MQGGRVSGHRHGWDDTMNITKQLKDILSAEFAGTKFSVRKTRNNGWVGQVIEVNWDGVIDSAIYGIVRLFELDNFGYTVEVWGQTAGQDSRFRIVAN